MYHGLLYDRTGAVTEIPGQDLIPPNAKVRAYPVREKHSWVWVWMGDAAACDGQPLHYCGTAPDLGAVETTGSAMRKRLSFPSCAIVWFMLK